MKSYWKQENDRLWKCAAELGVRVPVEPPVSDMPEASEEELEIERLRRENEKLTKSLEWARSLGGTPVALEPGQSPRMTPDEAEAGKREAQALERLMRKHHERPLAIEMIAEIDFHQQEQVSIYLESTAADDQEMLGEMALTTNLAIRMLSNLGRNQTSDTLARLLQMGRQLVQTFASGQSTGGFHLIPYPGHQGRKGFRAGFRFTETAMQLDLEPRGFGFLGRGLGYYAPTAVTAFVRFLSQKRCHDADFLCSLGDAIEKSGTLHLQGMIALTNHMQVVMSVLTLQCERYLPSQWRD